MSPGPDVFPRGFAAAGRGDGPQRESRTNVRLSLGRLLLLAALLAVAACSPQGGAQRFIGSDVTGSEFGRDFHLLDPDGRERALADFHGMYVLMFFGYTQCPDACPTALGRAVEIRNQLGVDRERVQVIFVTVDPERDTAPLMREYTSAFDPSFLGLRSDLSGTRKVAEEFRVFYEKVPTGSSYTMDHSALTYVFDAQGRLRLIWRPDQTAAECVSDLRSLMTFNRSFWRWFS
ncbi:MAG TPA: SCO family protein [Casimicrobiaceae bacterium]|nr:SCO family protein [Casimicrobiaceae bacterium]